jgi:diacylglycerol kinase (ATP)
VDQEMSELKNRLFAARLRFALSGFAHALAAERSVRTHLLALSVALAALLYLRPAPVWWALVLLASSTVIAAELFNTALETLADHLHPELHPQIRIVKDCAAAAVLVAVIGALCVAVALAATLFAGVPRS